MIKKNKDPWGLVQLVKDHGGVENFRCFALMGKITVITPFGFCLVSGNRETWTECKIDEDRYKVEDGYKITIRSLDPSFSYEHYYQHDFMQMMEAGFIVVKTNNSQHIEHVKWIDGDCCGIPIVHEADIVVNGDNRL